jgi:branched-chain amino acid transport system substrate-binding protein
MASGSASALQVKPVVSQAKIVALAPTNLNTNIAAPPDSDYSFMMGVPSTSLGTVFTEAFKKSNVKRVGFFTDDSATIAGTTAPILKKIRESGIEIVAEEKASTRATDVTAQVSRIKDRNPDVVYAHTLGGPFEAAFFSAVKEAMPNVMRVSGPSLCSEPEVWALARTNALDGIICGGNTTLDNPRTVAANAAIKAFVGSSYPGITSFDAQGYDSVFLLKLAIENAGNATDAAALKAGMEKITKFQAHWGNTSFTISYTAEKHNGADGICGVVFSVFKGNQPGGSWNVYQPAC